CAACVAVCRLETGASDFEREFALSLVEAFAEAEVNFSVSRIEVEDRLLGRQREGGQNEGNQRTGPQSLAPPGSRILQPSGPTAVRNPGAESSPTCRARSWANIAGLAASARRTRLRSQSVRSSVSSNSDMNAGRRARFRWLASYAARLPEARAPAKAGAWRKARRSPSPVIASTEPEASPIRTTLSRAILFNVRVTDTAPRSELAG